jgi:hypothetical protein
MRISTIYAILISNCSSHFMCVSSGPGSVKGFGSAENLKNGSGWCLWQICTPLDEGPPTSSSATWLTPPRIRDTFVMAPRISLEHLFHPGND